MPKHRYTEAFMFDAHFISMYNTDGDSRQNVPLISLPSHPPGIFSAKIFSRHNFKTIREVQYSSYRQNGLICFPNTGIHTSARVSVRLQEPANTNS